MRSFSNATSSATLEQQAFEQGLQEWVNQAPAVGSDENRIEAAQRILQCKISNSQELDLENL